MSTPTIAIVGLEASGKTVLMTALARKLAQTSSRGYFLDPIGNRTIKYIEKNWAILQSGEWPASTPPGEMFKLKWNFHVQNGKSACETASLQMIDAAGQDMRQLFSDESVLEQLPEHFRPLVQYMQNASILLVVLNIKDYIGEGDTTRKIENQAALKYALDVLQKSNRRAALIFTQMDQYSEFIDSRGGLENFCREELPYIYNAYVSSQKNPLIGVAAVNRTEVREMSDGTFQRVPAPGFDSDGLEQIGDWLAARVLELCQQEKAKEKAEKIRLEQERKQREREQNQTQENASPPWGSIITFLAIVGIIIAVIVANLGGSGESSDGGGFSSFVPPPPKPPVVSAVSATNTCNTGIFDCWSHHAEISCMVFNPDKSANIKITAYMMTSTGYLQKREQSVYIEQNHFYSAQFYFNNLNFCPMKQKWYGEVTAERLD